MRLLSLGPPGPFRAAERRVVTVTSLTGLVQGFGTSLLTATLPFTRLSLGITEGGMSLVLAVTRLGSLAALPLSSYGDRHGRRRPLLIGFLAFCLAGAATALAPEVVSFTIAQSLGRAATVGMSALAAVLLAEVLHPRVRAYGTSFYALAGSLGGGTALLLLPVAAWQPQAWRILFALGALGVAAFPVLAWALRESPIFRARPERVPLSAVWRAAQVPSFWKLAWVSFFVTGYSSPAISFVLERLINDLEWSASSARLLVIGGGAVGAVGVLAGGRMADLWGRRPATLLSLSLGLLGGVGFYWLEGGLLLSTAIAVGSFGSSAFIPSFTAHRSELFPTSVRATGAAWCNNAGIFGSLVSLTAGFWLIDRLGLTWSITLFGLGVVAAFLIVLGLPETRGLELTPD